MSGTVAPPGVNSLVKLRYGSREYASRVEDCEADRLILAAPYGDTVDRPRPGEVVTLCWSAGARGLYTAPIRLIEIDSGRLRLWTVELAAKPEVEQRRQFVRSGGGEAIRVQPLVRPPGSRPDAELRPYGKPYDGIVVDISEGGVRCCLNKPLLIVGQPVNLTIWLGPDEINVEATMLGTLETTTCDGIEVRFSFQAEEATGRTIRRYVIRRQIALRRIAIEPT